jgi:hypothetical protein
MWPIQLAFRFLISCTSPYTLSKHLWMCVGFSPSPTQNYVTAVSTAYQSLPF